ncbi:hypothetical protein AgCh_012187 [Apium graveolens]
MVRGDFLFQMYKLVIDLVEFSGREDDEGVASDFADIVTQMAQDYLHQETPLVFLFMVDSTEELAYHAISHLLSDFKDDVDAKVIVAGPSTTCSQKIHNQLVGVEKMHKDNKYVLFLDDDVRLHLGSIGALTAEMEKNPEPCSMGFATGGEIIFHMHSDDFKIDQHDVIEKKIDDVKKILQNGNIDAANEIVRGGKEHNRSYLVGRLIQKKEPKGNSTSRASSISDQYLSSLTENLSLKC